MLYSGVVFDWQGTLAGKQGFGAFVPKMIRELFESGYRLGILSNSNRYGDARWLRRRMAQEDLSQYIECILGSGGTLGEAPGSINTGCAGLHKPPDAFRRVTDFMWKMRKE